MPDHCREHWARCRQGGAIDHRAHSRRASFHNRWRRFELGDRSIGRCHAFQLDCRAVYRLLWPHLKNASQTSDSNCRNPQLRSAATSPPNEAATVLYVSGHGPIDTDGKSIRGKVGDALDVDQGYYAARRCGLGLLSTMRHHLGSLDRVTDIVKLLGMVNATPDFGKQPAVINGASDLMVEVFGDAGRHARSAVGMGSLPFDIAVEVELIVEISD